MPPRKLAEFKFFSALSTEQQAALLSAVELCEFSASDVVAEAGSLSKGALFIISGRVEALVEEVAYEFVAGDWLSELSLIQPDTHQLTFLAVQSSEALRFSPDSISLLRDQHAAVWGAVLESAFDSLRTKLVGVAAHARGWMASASAS